MSTVSLRPILRPSTLPSLPSSSTSATYICQSCRHARLLRRPKRPYSFTQLIALSDGSAFTIRTTSPVPVYRSTRDTRNAPLWNPSNKELQNVEADEAGRLAGFRARFGSSFDVQKEPAAMTTIETEEPSQESKKPKASSAQQGPFFREVKETKHFQSDTVAEEDYYEFEEEDANLLDLISSYGQEVAASKKEPPKPTAASGKKGKK